MLLLAGSTGLRRSGMIALTWKDVNAVNLEVTVLRSCVRNRFGDGKNTASRRPVPLHPLVLESLLKWKRESLYRAEADFVFASIRLKGAKPMGPDNLLKRYIRLVAEGNDSGLAALALADGHGGLFQVEVSCPVQGERLIDSQACIEDQTGKQLDALIGPCDGSIGHQPGDVFRRHRSENQLCFFQAGDA